MKKVTISEKEYVLLKDIADAATHIVVYGAPAWKDLKDALDAGQKFLELGDERYLPVRFTDDEAK